MLLFSLDVNLVDQLTALAQVAGEEKRLDARIQWLAAFSQVSSDVVVELSCDFNVAKYWTIFSATYAFFTIDKHVTVAKKVQKGSF